MWDFNFLFRARTPQWYLSLFSKNVVSGDISPVYYLIPEEEIRNISEFLHPSTKIIIILRDPIERVWSHTKMRVVKNFNKDIENAPQELIDDSFAIEFKACPSYVDLISKWKKYFKEDNIHICFYDQLVESPLEHFKAICDFLGISSSQLPPYLVGDITKRRNKGVEVSIPKEFAVHLARSYKPCIEELCKEYTNVPYPQKWLIKCNDILKNEKEDN